MRLLHLSDLHLGKKVFGFDMLPDQKIVLEEIKTFIQQHSPQAVIIAGDIYDRTNPPAEAISLFNNFLSDVLINLKTPILAVAGNHDGAELIGYGRELLSKVNLHIEGSFNKNIRKVTLQDEYGNVDFFLLPFAEHQVVRDVLQDPSIQSPDLAMQSICQLMQSSFTNSHRKVLITHGYIGGGNSPEICESEKPISIGGKSWVSAEHLSQFDYVALGHLHKAQQVNSNKIRYAGSLLKYSFSEQNHQKSATLVDINEYGEVTIQLLPITLPHDMCTLQGSFQDLLTNIRTHLQNSYLQVILTDKEELWEPKRQLDKIYPYIMLFGIAEHLDSIRTLQITSANRKNKPPIEMIEDFYFFCTEQHMSDNERSILINSMEDICDL